VAESLYINQGSSLLTSQDSTSCHRQSIYSLISYSLQLSNLALTAEPMPGPSTTAQPKKEEPSRTTRHSSFAYSLGSSPSSREPSPVRAGFSFGAQAPPPQAASTPTPVAMPHIPKLSSPDAYDGKKRWRPAMQWLSRVLAWIELSRAAFPVLEVTSTRQLVIVTCC
jgi:hypothetical protein